MAPRQERIDWQCVHRADAQVGEMPVWVPEDGSLFWVDITGKSLNRRAADGTVRRWSVPNPIGTFALAHNLTSAVVALATGLFRLGLNDGSLSALAAAPYDTANYQFNDGRCDRAGRFWVGTARSAGSSVQDGGAAWYRFDERGLTRQMEGTTIANGLAWSPDNRTLYIADRPNWQILAFQYNLSTGIAADRRVFTTITQGEIPDGATVDTQGGYWIAMHRAGRILRFRPDGVLDRDLRAPVTHPTMVAFGGPDYSVLYLTSARAPADTAAEPLAGAIFAANVGVRGLPEPRFSVGLDQPPARSQAGP
jgi:sugar lactone lactonase YvrE